MHLSNESRERFRQKLLDMRQELIDQVHTGERLTREKEYAGDLGDFAVTDLATEYVYMLSDRLRKRLLLIEEALEALENGDYGICEDCEEPINEKRLLLLPFTRWCVQCQSERERRAKLRGGSLSDVDLAELRFTSEEDES